MAAEYGVYTLAEIYTQIFGSAPSSASDLATVRTYIKGLGGLPVSRTNINQYYMPNDFFTKTAYTGSQAMVVPGSSASSAWTAYKEAQGAVSQLTGGATQGGQMVKSAEIGYFRFPESQSPTGYNYKPAALLKMPLPTVAAAVAPLAGVAVGATMYQENPELWTKLSRALIPWAYPDAEGQAVDLSKGLMPVWTEAAEAAGELVAKALLPAPVVDLIKNLFKDEGIISESGYTESLTKESVDGYTGNYSGAAPFHVEITNPSGSIEEWELIVNTPGEGYMFKVEAPSGATSFTVAKPTNSTFRWTLRHKGKTATNWSNVGTSSYGGCAYTQTSWASNLKNMPGASNDSSPYESRPDPGNKKVESLLRNIASTATPFIGHDTPGVQKWGSGSVYPLPENPSQIILQNPDGTEQAIDAYPVPLPMTPGQSTDPNIQGIDDPLVDISKQVDPYIQETSDPYSDPSPSPNPPGQPDPRVDPSQKQEPTNPLQPGGPTSPPPPSDGETPTPSPPIIPPPFTSEGGLIAVYNPPQSTLVAFANWLWVTYQDATIQKIWNNPFDGVISLHELYCTPPVIGSRSIKSGFLDSEIVSPIIGRYTEINCGSIVIPEYWNNYLDYAPYSKAFVYLPFIGIIELEADDIVGHAVNITYRVDCYNGSCIAMITVAKEGPNGETYNNTVYQYSGNCAVELPLSGGSQANIKAAIINATAWGLGSVISGLVTAAGTGPIAGLAGAGQAISGALQATAGVVNAKSSVQHSGTFGASFGAMGIKRPYIIVKRPVQVQVLNYNEIYGYQAHKAVTIGACEGYLRCREVHVTSATANDEEKQLIEQYLKTGVIV